MSDRVLPIVVIYKYPSDFPRNFVVRRQWACADGEVLVEKHPLAVVDTLTEARDAVPAMQDYRMPRDPDDDPAIVECWL